MPERLATAGFLAGWWLIGRLPEPVAYGIFTLVADLLWWRRGSGVLRLEANVARAVETSDPATLRRLSRHAMRSYLRYWCDAFRLPQWSRQDVLVRIRLEHAERLHDAYRDGRGLVAALAHQGNWDHAGAWSTFELAKVTTVAERLKPETVFDRFVAYREQLGMEILPLTGGSGNLFATLVSRVKAGGFVPLLCDRDLSGSGIEVEFLGERAKFAAGPAALALTAGAPLVPVSTWYERRPEGGWRMVLHAHPPIEVPAEGNRAEKVRVMTQACADALGSAISAHPQDWHMLQRVFVADLRS